MTRLARLNELDRRWIYVLVFLSVSLPTFFGIPTRVEPTPPVREVYDAIAALPPHSLVWVPFDIWSTSRAEVQPAALAAVRDLFARGHRVVVTSVIPDGVSISEYVVGRAATETGRKYGEDYAILGYKSGSGMVIKQVCGNLAGTFPVDIHGTPLEEMPVTRAFHNARNVDLIFVVSDNNMFDQYAAIANTEYGRTVTGCTTAVMMPILSPYLNSHQLLGVVGGLRGGAEYETLTSVRGEATAGMTAQSVMHLLIVGLIVVSNVGYFAARREAS